MAEQNNSTSSNDSKSFDKSLNKDVNDFHLPTNEWSGARNAINNSITGDLGKLGNEPANLLCLTTDLKYPIIGFIHIIEDKWAVFSTDSVNSEIGLFVESNCGVPDPIKNPAYSVVVNAACLNFKPENLIIGVSRATSTCTYKLYWDDGLNPSRVLEIDVDNPLNNLPFLPPPAPPGTNNPNSPIPWVQNCVDSNGPAPGGCIICTNTPVLDCDKLRLAQFMSPICPRVANGVSGGNLLNGSYLVAMAYAIKGQKISDWYVSNVQSLWTQGNSSGSLDVFIDSIDLDFDEILVTLISVVNQQAVGRDAGIYSTRQTRLSFDIINDAWPAVPVEQLPIMTPIVDKSDAMYAVGDYLIRVGPTNKQDFNYQPLANQIVAKWQSVEYPGDYYAKGGNKTNYMRDEVYAFFIQWIYDTGDKSASYHIPGRPAFPPDLFPEAPGVGNAFQGDTFSWQVNNTATAIPIAPVPQSDGGVLIGEGYMGYWESTEFYPDKTPQIWNADSQCWSSLTPNLIPNCTEPIPPIPYPGTVAGNASYNLCGTPIRHHKFPEDNLVAATNRYNAGLGTTIRIMGVKFENVRAPRDNSGNLIPGIIGYRILRGTRNGNKTIIAKGMINNMHEYTVPGSTKSHYMPNYPYNDLEADPFLSTTKTFTSSSFNPLGNGGGVQGDTPFPGGFGSLQFSPNYVTFHSPDTNFKDPFLSAKELRIYQNIHGDVTGKFELSEKHPREKLMTDYVFLVSAIGGLGIAALNLNGERTTNTNVPNYQGFSYRELYSKTADYDLDHGGNNTLQPGGVQTYGPAMPNAGTLTQTTGATTNVNENTTGDVTNSAPIKAGFASAPDPDFWDTLLIQGPLVTQLGFFNAYAGTVGLSNLIGATTGSAGPADSLKTQAGLMNNDAAIFNAGGSWAYGTTNISYKDGQQNRIPSFLNTVVALPTFLNYFSDGTDGFIRLILAILRYRDYAVRYHSHGFYNKTDSKPTVFRTTLAAQQYIDPEILDYQPGVAINNLYRQRTVVLEMGKSFGVDIAPPPVIDKTRYDAAGLTAPGFWDVNIFNNPIYTIEDLCSKEITGSQTKNNGQICSSYYAALKVRIDNQYGQLNRIVQVPIDNCYVPVTINKVTKQIVPGKGNFTKSLFGGDTYVNRYTEKNNFQFFYDWLYGEPEGAQFNYQQHNMIPYPKYWANFNKFQTSDFTTSFTAFLINPVNWPNIGNPGTIITPRDYYALDGPGNSGPWVTNIKDNFRFDKRGWFYLFNSGIRDFFVESEINLAQRERGELQAERFYNPYFGGNSKDLTTTDIIKVGNYYKYDESLSIAKLFINYASWASTQSPSYNPYIAETCFLYQPKRVIYSLPAQFEGLRDGWKIFLPNNYQDFLNIVTCIKPVNKSGAMIFFDAASPVQFQGTDQLQTDLGTKLTIGDGGLFTQPLQALINVDASHEYASCQNRLSVINTPAGLFWMSQNQGKVFSLADGIKEVSNINLKWWFAKYLPYKIIEDFPDFALIDNPVIGVGCQSIYDNQNGLIYFCKKDYILRKDITETLTYVGSNKFKVVETGAPVVLGNPLFFEDASWTISYDPKTGGWLSQHDWHPTLNMPGKNTFMTVNPTDKKGIWIHNTRCDLYANYYGKNYPFEVEFIVNSGQQINTLRSIEYIMEVYKYAENCYDRFHVLDFNFDEAVIYNTEQVSGLLKLNLSPLNNPFGLLNYPVVGPTDIQILFTKKENKYRFNQFWDITDDRGEFFNPAIPGFAQRPIWDTEPNGYIRTLNPSNLNYSKDPFQRKKFRHYTVSVLLRRKVSGDKKMLVMIANVKNLYSPR
jgi:hypothetical protein